MPAYDDSYFDPPAPVANVIVRNPDTGVLWPDVPMLLDTGADVTLIPAQVVQKLGLTTDLGTQYELVGFDGSIHFAPTVRLELLFLHRAFRGQFLLIDQERGILGRNILNVVALLLDGPHLRWDEYSLSRARS